MSDVNGSVSLVPATTLDTFDGDRERTPQARSRRRPAAARPLSNCCGRTCGGALSAPLRDGVHCPSTVLPKRRRRPLHFAVCTHQLLQQGLVRGVLSGLPWEAASGAAATPLRIASAGTLAAAGGCRVHSACWSVHGPTFSIPRAAEALRGGRRGGGGGTGRSGRRACGDAAAGVRHGVRRAPQPGRWHRLGGQSGAAPRPAGRPAVQRRGRSRACCRSSGHLRRRIAAVPPLGRDSLG